MTQKEQILNYIREFGSITPMESFADLGITKLATRVSEMKIDGVQFTTETIKTYNRFGKPVYYSQYSLKENNNA